MKTNKNQFIEGHFKASFNNIVRCFSGLFEFCFLGVNGRRQKILRISSGQSLFAPFWRTENFQRFDAFSTVFPCPSKLKWHHIWGANLSVGCFFHLYSIKSGGWRYICPCFCHTLEIRLIFKQCYLCGPTNQNNIVKYGVYSVLLSPRSCLFCMHEQ